MGEDMPMEDNWQLSCTELRQRGAHVLRTGLLADCVLIVGKENASVSAHRLLLAMASPVFEKLLFSNDKCQVCIPDMKVETINSVLEYIYTDEITTGSFSEVFDLCCAAHKYEIGYLTRTYADYLTANMTAPDACRSYELACLIEDNRLKEKAVEILCQDTKEVLQNTAFEDIKLSTLVMLFSLDTLNIENELDLLTAAERYASVHNLSFDQITENGLSIRNALQQIRFLTLTLEQLTEVETPLITAAEMVSIMKNIKGKAQVAMPAGFSPNRERREIRKKVY